MPRAAACAAALLAFAAPPARAARLPPACGPARDGVQMCMTREVCTCRHDPGGSVAGRAPGWRWRCDILASCGPPVPATLPEEGGGAWPGPLYVSPNVTFPGGTGTGTGGAPPAPPAPPLPRRP